MPPSQGPDALDPASSPIADAASEPLATLGHAATIARAREADHRAEEHARRPEVQRERSRREHGDSPDGKPIGSICGEPLQRDREQDKSSGSPQEAVAPTALVEAPTTPEVRTDDSPPPPRRRAIPDVLPGFAPVYAAGSLHGPIYDSRGARVERPAPPVVGTLTPAGKLERLAGRHRSAA